MSENQNLRPGDVIKFKSDAQVFGIGVLHHKKSPIYWDITTSDFSYTSIPSDFEKINDLNVFDLIDKELRKNE